MITRTGRNQTPGINRQEHLAGAEFAKKIKDSSNEFKLLKIYALLTY